MWYRRIWFDVNYKLFQWKITAISLIYNSHLSWSYVCDIIMGPIMWIVDNLSHLFGPIFVGAVVSLSTSIVFICFWIGLPYWWQKNPSVTICLVFAGHIILANVVFHYYCGCTVSPGEPPEGVFIPEAVSICKKCISPKPPRTHHCSVCNKCILKMDHHCPWLNNCVGMWNHHHFFLYMMYTLVGVLFIIVFGVGLFLEKVWWAEENEIVGHPVPMNTTLQEVIEHHETSISDKRYKWAIIYTALICSGTFIALGALTCWHARLITRGETSIEAHINAAERSRYAAEGLSYKNPYDFGWRRNWAMFLGIENLGTMAALRRVLLPSTHSISRSSLSWPTLQKDLKRL